MAKKQPAAPAEADILGKTPPHDLETEETVLGSIMLDQDALSDIVDVLKPEHFYDRRNGAIYSVMLDLYDQNAPIDILTVTNALAKSGAIDEVGGKNHVAALTQKVASSAFIEYHSKIVVQKFLLRELIRIASDMQRKSFEESEDVVELIDSSENELFMISEGSIKKNVVPVSEVLRASVEQITRNSQRPEGVNGVPSGFTELDKVTNGWQPSDLVIVAARPSMGKTAFVLSMARNMAVEHNRAVAFFSLEMSSTQLVNRLIASECEIPADTLRSGRLTDTQWTMLDQRLKGLTTSKLFIDDTPSISILELKSKCRRLVKEHDLQIIIIDYLQLMSGGKAASRELEVANISRSLKALAKELNVPILALSQLNRSVESRGKDKRPQLSDLRESGSIEQDADIVVFIHRPEYYGLTEMPDGSPAQGKAEIILAKHRNGAVGSVVLEFVSQYARFENQPTAGLPDTMSFDNRSLSDDNIPTIVVQSKLNTAPLDADFDLDIDAPSAGEPVFDNDIPF